MTTSDYWQIKQQGVALVQEAGTLAVVDDESFQHAGAFLQAIKGYLKRVGEVLDPIIRTAHAAHKTAVGQKTALEQHAKEAERVLKGRMATYEAEQARLRRQQEDAAREERARLEAQAKEAAEAERKRLEAEAETERLNAALEAEAKGDTETAEKILEAPPIPVAVPEPAMVFTPPPSVDAPKAEGISFRESWSAEVVDLMALVKAVANHEAPLPLLQPDTKALNGMARSLKGELRIPGVRAVMERVAAVRA